MGVGGIVGIELDFAVGVVGSDNLVPFCGLYCGAFDAGKVVGPDDAVTVNLGNSHSEVFDDVFVVLVDLEEELELMTMLLGSLEQDVLLYLYPDR